MIAEHKGEIPVVILLIPFIAGISLGLYVPHSNASFLWVALTLNSLTFIVLGIGYNQFGLYKLKWIGGALLLPFLIIAGWLSAVQHNELNNLSHFSLTKADYLIAHINSEPNVKGDLVRFTATITHSTNNGKPQPVSGTLLVTIKDEIAKNLFYGEELIMPANYSPVDPPFNPGEFNYKQYLANKNIFYQLFLYPKQYSVIKAGYGNPLIAYALQTRQILVKKLYNNMHDSTAIAVASTLILGYKADLSNDLLQAYSKTGTIHILSVSGGHVAILYILLAFMLQFLDGYKRGKVLKAVIIILLIWCYALLTGFSPAVNRAALMISMGICGKSYSRYINTLNILAFSAFVLLLYDPFLLRDVGFQLSYLAVAGLIVFQPIIYRWLDFKNRAAKYLWNACSVSIAAQVTTFPLSAFYFHQFPVYFLLSNLLIIAPVVIIMYAGLFLLLIPQTEYLTAALGYILEHTILLMNKMLGFVEHTPYAVVNKIWLTNADHALLYLIIIAAFYGIYSKQKWPIKITLSAMLLFFIGISLKKFRADDTRSVTFLNLRKHTGIVFKHGNEGIVITDLADTDKVFRYSVQPGLDSSRITSYKIYHTDAGIRNSWLMKDDKLIQFGNKKLLLLNHEGGILSIPRQVPIGYIYLANNAFVNPNAITNQLLIMDGSNKDNYIDGMQKITDNYSVLKRNKSITIVSNE